MTIERGHQSAKLFGERIAGVVPVVLDGRLEHFGNLSRLPPRQQLVNGDFTVESTDIRRVDVQQKLVEHAHPVRFNGCGLQQGDHGFMDVPREHVRTELVALIYVQAGIVDGTENKLVPAFIGNILEDCVPGLNAATRRRRWLGCA